MVLTPGIDNGSVNPLPEKDARAALAWLSEGSDTGLTGFDPTGWETTVWIVNAMYETESLPGVLSYDDERRIEEAADPPEPVIIGETSLNDLLGNATLTGGSLGRSSAPGPGWERLRWSELAARLGVDPYAIEVPPCHRSFPFTSWPVNIAPPAEGSLDREQFVLLIEHLAAATTDGYDAACLSYYSPLSSGGFDTRTVFRCELGELTELYDDVGLSGSPSNIWPEDRSWFVYTDWDLWSTKVSGSGKLITSLLGDNDLEAITLNF